MTRSKFPITLAALLGLLGTCSLGAQTLPAWIAVDYAGRTVSLALETTPAPEPGSGRINGHGAGDIQVLVPLGWTVRWSWRNADSTAPHSLVVMAEREKLPLEGGRPALDNAMSRMVTAGLKPGQTDQTTFTADEAGWYWLLCGVPGHALKGEWISLKIDRDATSPGVMTKALRRE
jgi:hypothetical protein